MNQTNFGFWVLSASTVAVALTLSGCGGSSSSSTPPVTSTTLAAEPATFIAFGGAPNTVSVTGGKGPFRVVSSNPTVLPVVADVIGASFTFSANNVANDTPVTLTVTDTAAATSTVTVTVTPATISAPLIKIAAAAGSTCAPVNNPASSVATLCASEAGTASVTLKDSAGAALANRAVRFEALTIGATLASTATSTTFSRIATVNTDAQGVATVALRADVEATSEAAFLRATDTVSNHRIDSWITVLKQVNGASALNVVPTTGGMVGYYSNECPFVRREFNVYGGTAPYAVTLPAGSTLVLSNDSAAAVAGSGVTVANAGGRFTVENADSITCGTATTTDVTATDAKGATVVAKYNMSAGSNTRSATASTDLFLSPPTLSLASDPLSAYCSSSTGRFTVSGGTAPYVVSASLPQFSTVLSGGTSVAAAFQSGPKWKLLKGQTTKIFVMDAAGKVAQAALSCI